MYNVVFKSLFTAPFSLVVIVGVFLAVFVPAFCVFIYMGSVMVISRQCSQRRHKGELII